MSTPESPNPAPAPPVGRVAATRAWVAAHRPAVLAGTLLSTAYVVAYLSVVRFQELYAPDSRYYAAMSLWFGGWSKEDAREEVATYGDAVGIVTPDLDILFGWGLVQPRVVLPALSVPFVKLMGVDGLAVVPAVAMAAAVGLLAWMVWTRYGAVPAIVTSLLVVTSVRLMFFGVAMLTESLTALWCALILVAAWRYRAEPRARWVVAMIAFTVLMAFTRQATLIPAGALVAAWVLGAVTRNGERRWGVPALAVAVTTVVVQVAQTLVFPSFSQANQFLRATGTDTLGEALAAAPGLGWHILVTDIGTFMQVDRALLLLVLLSTIAAVVLWRRSEAHLLAGAFAATAVYNITNGTPTDFRYAMPGLVFWVVAVAALLAVALPRTAGDDGAEVMAGDAREQQRADGTPSAATPGS